MERLNTVINGNRKKYTNGSNDYNDNTVSKNPKYAYDPSKFTPNTEESQFALEIATYFRDTDNFAYYMGLVKRRGVGLVKQLFAETRQEIAEKSKTDYPVLSPKKWFAWKAKRRFFGQG